MIPLEHEMFPTASGPDSVADERVSRAGEFMVRLPFRAAFSCSGASEGPVMMAGNREPRAAGFADHGLSEIPSILPYLALTAKRGKTLQRCRIR